MSCSGNSCSVVSNTSYQLNAVWWNSWSSVSKGSDDLHMHEVKDREGEGKKRNSFPPTEVLQDL